MFIDDLVEAFEEFSKVCLKAKIDSEYFFIKLNSVFTECSRKAVLENYSNNWLKMHGIPMRRKLR